MSSEQPTQIVKKAPALNVPAQQDPVDKWKNLQNLTTERLFISVALGLVIFLLIFLGAMLLERSGQVPAEINFYDTRGFTEWLTDGTPLTEQLFHIEIWQATMRLFQALPRVIFDNFHHSAGIIRSISIVTVALVTLVAYRFRFLDEQKTSYLDRRLAYEERKAQQDDFANLGGCLFFVTRIVFFVASVFGTYVVLSMLLALSSLAFPGLKMNYDWTAVFVALVCAIINGIVVYWILAIDSREILLLGLGTWLGGLILSFVFAGQEDGKLWWCESISYSGREMPSAPIFTASFLSFALAMIALWFDFDSLLQKFVIHYYFKANRVEDLKNSTIIRWIRFLYVVMLLGFLCVGFIRTSETYLINSILHIGGIFVAGICVIIFALYAIYFLRNYFNPFYINFSIAHIVIVIGATFLYFTPNEWTVCEGGLITLTAYEIVVLSLVLIWVYLTLDNLAFYSNQHWDELKDIQLDNSNWLDRTWEWVKARFGIKSKTADASNLVNPDDTQ